MRATVVCIQPKLKRKLNEQYTTTDFNNNENSVTNTKKLKTACTSMSPVRKSGNEAKALTATHYFIKSICDTIKRSAKKMFNLRLFNSSSITHEDDLSENKENELPGLHINSALYKISLDNNKCRRPNFAMLTSLPLNDNMCLQDPKFAETVSTRMSVDDLSEYLEKKKHILRQCKTTDLPTHVMCSSLDIQKFIWLIEEDPMISLFLKRDICRRYADKYLLAMVLIYFARAHYTARDFSRENFFAALYLAHDMEEDHEEIKYEVFPYCLGIKWKKYYTYLLSIRDDLFWALDCRAVVSRKCCEQVMSLIPNHWIWERERPEYHTFVSRAESQRNNFCQPRGPFKSPLWCRTCLERDCGDSENSYIVYTSLSDTSSAESLDESKQTVKKDSGFESFLKAERDDTDEEQFFDTSLESNEVLSSSPEADGVGL